MKAGVRGSEIWAQENIVSLRGYEAIRAKYASRASS